MLLQTELVQRLGLGAQVLHKLGLFSLFWLLRMVDSRKLLVQNVVFLVIKFTSFRGVWHVWRG